MSDKPSVSYLDKLKGPSPPPSPIGPSSQCLASYQFVVKPELLENQIHRLKYVDPKLIGYVRDVLRAVISRMEINICKGSLNINEIVIRDGVALIPKSMSNSEQYVEEFKKFVSRIFQSLRYKGHTELDHFTCYVNRMSTLGEMRYLLQHPFLMCPGERQAYPMLAFPLLEAVVGMGWRARYQKYVSGYNTREREFDEAAVAQHGAFRAILQGRLKNMRGKPAVAYGADQISNLEFVRNACAHWGENNPIRLEELLIMLQKYFEFVLVNLFDYIKQLKIEDEANFFR